MLYSDYSINLARLAAHPFNPKPNAGNRTLSLEVSIPSGLKPPTALSPSLAGVKRGRSAPSTPRDARASARVGVRRGTRASSRTEG